MASEAGGQSRHTFDFPEPSDCHNRQGPSAKQWEDVKILVRQLYLVEHRSLKYVQAQLEQKYGFRAS